MHSFRLILPVNPRQCCFSSAAYDFDEAPRDVPELVPIMTAFATNSRTSSANIRALLDADDSSLVVCSVTLEVLESVIFEAGGTIELSGAGITASHSPVTEMLASCCTVRDSKTELWMEFCLPEEEIGTQFFAIIFKKLTNHFSLADLGKGTGTFMKIIEPMLLKSRLIISFGDSHMAVNVQTGSRRQVLDRPTLRILFIDGPKRDQSFSFEPSEAEVKIGRMIDCQVRFDETSLSRYQTVIRYEEQQGWVILDGDGRQPSTNGTWLFLEEPIRIKSGVVFKGGSTLFQIV
jgi:hypothetical protein